MSCLTYKLNKLIKYYRYNNVIIIGGLGCIRYWTRSTLPVHVPIDLQRLQVLRDEARCLK